jgi:chromosome partitioning protein
MRKRDSSQPRRWGLKFHVKHSVEPIVEENEEETARDAVSEQAAVEEILGIAVHADARSSNSDATASDSGETETDPSEPGVHASAPESLKSEAADAVAGSTSRVDLAEPEPLAPLGSPSSTGSQGPQAAVVDGSEQPNSEVPDSGDAETAVPAAAGADTEGEIEPAQDETEATEAHTEAAPDKETAPDKKENAEADAEATEVEADAETEPAANTADAATDAGMDALAEADTDTGSTVEQDAETTGDVETAGAETQATETQATETQATETQAPETGEAGAASPDASTGHEDESTPLARELTEITRRRRALASQKLPLPAETRVFTVANQKGGVGKTTSAVNLAAALARTGARVLVIDLDPQGNASTALGVEHRSETTSVYDVMINDELMANVVQKSPEFDSLYCVPATIHLAGAEIELVSLVAREQRLRTALRTFLSTSPDPFHYVFIDCPPSLGLLTINAFVAAREVLIPIQCEYYALEGLSQLLTNIQLIERHLNSDLTVSTILLTMYDSRTNLANQVAQEVRDHFPDQVLSTLIPRSVRISEAPSYGQSVISYDSNSSGSLSYLEAAAEIARRGVPN